MTKTCEQVKAEFAARGETFSGWADRHGFTHSLVYAVTSGRIIGRRGKAHEVALRLGLKAPVERQELSR